MMTVKDLLMQEIDIDVCDDYDERCYIAFCGPAKLTKEGEREFAESLTVPVEVWGDTYGLLVSDRIEDDDHEEPIENLNLLFHALAGYCSEKNYEKWFEEAE